MEVLTRPQSSLEDSGISYAIILAPLQLAMPPEDHFINLSVIEISVDHQPYLLNRSLFAYIPPMLPHI